MPESNFLARWRELENRLTVEVGTLVKEFQIATGCEVEGIDIRIVSVLTYCESSAPFVEKVRVDVRPKAEP